MFEKSSSWQRLKPASKRVIQVNLGYVPYLEPDDQGESRRRRIAIALAVAAHLVFFVVQFPAGREKPLRAGNPKKAFVVQQVRFKPPPPAPQKQIPKKKEKRRVIPVPDPTPEEPEPIRLAELDVPDIDVTSDDLLFGIPDGPPASGTTGEGPVRLDGSITPPLNIHDPRPRYTEEGRQARVQGVVILEAVVDEEGNVARVRVLKGPPRGLSEEAVKAAKLRKYRPATRAGQAVAVFVNLTIRFSLQ